MNRLTASALGLAVLLGASANVGAESVPPGYVSIGGVNLNFYCSTTFGANYKSFLIGNTAGDWVCNFPKNKGPGKSISVKDACRLQYGKTGLIAHAVSWNDPLSWQCFQRRGLRPKG